MTSNFKSSSLPSGLDTVELDRAIHNLEFEKEQQNKELEKERQQIAALEASLKEKQDEIRKIETDITRMDEETKSYHRQFRQIKENKESLKKHSSVLNIHLETIEKKRQQLADKYASESSQHEETLQHYHDIWKSYEEVYMQQANAQELMKWQLEVLQRKEAIKEGNLKITRLRAEINNIEAEINENKPPFANIQDFIIKIAEIKVSTMTNYKEAEQLVYAISSEEKEIRLLQENQAEIMTKIEEKRRHEEQERQRKEKEKAEIEKAQQEGLLKKKNEEQQTAANQPGVYKFGQFVHRAPCHLPPSRVPTTKRSTPSQPPPSPRTPLLIPSPAGRVKRSTAQAPAVTPSNKCLAPFTKYMVASVQGHKSTTASNEQSGVPLQKANVLQQGSRCFLNMPPSLAPGVRGGHKKQTADEQGRGPIPQDSSAISTKMVMTPNTALRSSLRQLTLQTPASAPSSSFQAAGRNAPPSTSAGPLPIPMARTGSPKEQRADIPMGPGGDAQPCSMVSPEQQQYQTEGMQYECSSQSNSVYEAESNANMEVIQEFPMTPRSSVASGSAPQTPKSPDPVHLDLQGFKDRLEKTKSPGFSYSFRSMFGEQDEPSAQDQASASENNNGFQENPFFSSLFSMGGRSSDQPASPSPANLFGNGECGSNTNQRGSSSAPLQRVGEGAAMALFGPDSPAGVMQTQSQQQESMGFSLDFGDGAQSQDAGTGGKSGSKSGFCLF